MPQLPQYKQIYESLRRSIAKGDFSAGELLPSENQLCETYRVTRPTARKALDQLVADGFIFKQQGKGSIVKGVPKGVGILSVTGTTSALGNASIRTQITIKPRLRKWAEAFSFELTEQEKQSGCIYFERLRIVDGKPLFYDITMLANINLAGFTDYDLTDKSLFDFLRQKYQITVTGGTQQLFAIRADKRMQEYLGVKSGYPILQLNRKIETSRPGFFVYSQLFCVTRDYGLTGTF